MERQLDTLGAERQAAEAAAVAAAVAAEGEVRSPVATSLCPITLRTRRRVSRSPLREAAQKSSRTSQTRFHARYR